MATRWSCGLGALVLRQWDLVTPGCWRPVAPWLSKAPQGRQEARAGRVQGDSPSGRMSPQCNGVCSHPLPGFASEEAAEVPPYPLYLPRCCFFLEDPCVLRSSFKDTCCKRSFGRPKHSGRKRLHLSLLSFQRTQVVQGGWSPSGPMGPGVSL